MSAVEVKKAQNNLTCPVCYQLFKNPKYLPCYHSYCEECLEKMQVQSKIICPECRKEAKVPAGGVKELPNNFFINRLVDDLILKKKVEGEQEVKCDECNNDPVVSFCPNCNFFFCLACNDHHTRSKLYRGHAIVPLTELKSNKDAPKVKIPLCKEHDEQLKYYCETCDQLVCMYCTVKKHNGHHHDSVKQLGTKHRNELKKITDPVEGMIKNLFEASDSIDKMMKMMKRRGEEVDKKIDRYYDELLQKLMIQKDEVKQQARDAVSQKEKAMITQLEEVTSMQAKLMSIKELTDVLEQSSDQEALSAKKQVTDRVHQLTNAYKKVNIKPVESAAMDFVPTKDSFPVFGHLFAYVNPHTSEANNLPQSQCTLVGKKVEFAIVTKDCNGDCYVKGGSQVSVQLKSFTSDVTAGEVRDNNDGSYMASFIAEQVGEAKVLVSINGEQIKGSPYSIVVVRNYQAIDKPSKIVNNNGSMGEPWGVAFGRNGLWAVVDNSNHCVYIFDDKDQLVRKFGSNGSNNGQFSYPIGVAFDNHNHLYVVDNNNHRVQKFDTNGNYLLQFGSKGASDGQLNGPYGVTVHNDKVYIADYSNKHISVFQTNGKFCISFGSDQLGRPIDVTVSANNYLLVADSTNSCIYTYTLDGQYVGKFGTRGSGRGQLDIPFGLTTDLNGFIIVADSGNHCVSIFDKDHNYIHCFGSNGTANGQFKYPDGIAVSPNGSIYVSDSDNQRIQIFSNF